MLKTHLVESGNDAGSQLRVQRSAGRALVAVLALLAMQPALAGPIDLRLFYTFPAESVVTGSTDGTAAGSFAQMSESLDYGVVSLSNDPGLGDPVLIDASEGPVLRFQYEFISESPTDCGDLCDTLVATLFAADPNDSTIGGPLDGFLANAVINALGIGEVSFLLSSFNLPSNLVFGLQFDLLAFDAGAGSAALVRGLEVYDPNAVVNVAEPPGLALLLIGLIAMVARRRLHQA
jgi:hypothetical protein